MTHDRANDVINASKHMSTWPRCITSLINVNMQWTQMFHSWSHWVDQCIPMSQCHCNNDNNDELKDQWVVLPAASQSFTKAQLMSSSLACLSDTTWLMFSFWKHISHLFFQDDWADPLCVWLVALILSHSLWTGTQRRRNCHVVGVRVTLKEPHTALTHWSHASWHGASEAHRLARDLLLKHCLLKRAGAPRLHCGSISWRSLIWWLRRLQFLLLCSMSFWQSQMSHNVSQKRRISLDCQHWDDLDKPIAWKWFLLRLQSWWVAMFFVPSSAQLTVPWGVSALSSSLCLDICAHGCGCHKRDMQDIHHHDHSFVTLLCWHCVATSLQSVWLATVILQ